ncbi:hypothetical protein F4781DRAFT_314016 [Annulohypoxylon bovei var. microspora]|nr:hypothetical protein F4781DRAFT_314016 [Annulohypoxylon bovei var. microspora]
MTATLPPGTTTTVPGPLSDYDNLVPLLTTFTPGDGCANSWVYDVQTEGTVWKDRHYNTHYAEACQPFAGANTIYRPGVCPDGQEFKSLDVLVESDKGGSSRGASWYVGLCCSTGYKLSYRERFSEYPECFSGLVPPVVATVKDETTTQNDMSTPPTTTVGSAVVGIEEPISIVWKEGDLTYFSASVANSLRALMGLAPLPTTTTGSVSSTPLLGPASTSPTEKPGQNIADTATPPAGLSGGAIAGICVGAVAFLIVLLASIFYLGCVRRRRKRRGQQGPEALANTASNHDSQLKKRSGTSWLRPWRREALPPVKNAPGELHGQDTQEIDGRQARVAELQGAQMGGHAELQGAAVATSSHMPAELES